MSESQPFRVSHSEDVQSPFAPLEDSRRASAKKRRIVCAFVVACLLAVGITLGLVLSKKSSSSPWEEIRLPSAIRPTHYNLSITPDLVSFNYTGHVDVELTVSESSRHVLIHALYLNIDHVSLSRGSFLSERSSVELDAKKPFFLYEENQFLVVQPASSLAAGTYVLSIDFSAPLGDSLVGFYRSSYVTPEGDRRYLATTKFEPTFARRAFPCFDEPAMKANYSIRMSAYDPYGNLTFLSNMPQSSNGTTIDASGRVLKTAEFETSVQMSTYLVAFIACDFVFIEAQTRSPNGEPMLFEPKTVRVWAPAHKIHQATLALDSAAQILAYYERFFGLEYPLPKQDLIAIPDFISGAMENWGLITFRETALLYDPKESSESNKQRAVVVVAHELAHQWFGNLVTMDWWDGLWLNEGFASYVEYLGTAAVQPDWDMQAQFVADDMQNALTLDSGDASHPILQPVSHPNQINELFDSISYDKGASVIRMMNGFMQNIDNGHGFNNGLKIYLTRHAYANTQTKDLWNAMTQAAKEAGHELDVAAVMDTWTLQQGYPLLTLSNTSDPLVYTLSGAAARFLAFPAGSASTEDKNSYSWRVPITATASNQMLNGSVEFMDGKDKSAFQLRLSRPIDWSSEWLKINSDSQALFRVLYAPEHYRALGRAMTEKADRLTQNDRQGLFSDAFAAAFASRLPFEVALDVSTALKVEEDYSVWLTALKPLGKIQGLVRDQVTFGPYSNYVLSLLKPIYNKLGWDIAEGDSHTNRLLRSLVLDKACEYGLEDCIAKATDMFQKLKQDPKNFYIPPALRSAVYNTAVRQGGVEEWEWMFAWYQRAQTVSASEQSRCITALAQSRVPWLLNRLLGMTLPGGEVRSQDSSSVISAVASSSSVGQRLAYQFLQANWDTLYTMFVKSGGRSFGPLCGTIVRDFQTQADYDMAKAFLSGRDFGPGAKQVTDGLNNILRNVAWMKDKLPSVQQWLENHQ